MLKTYVLVASFALAATGVVGAASAQVQPGGRHVLILPGITANPTDFLPPVLKYEGRSAWTGVDAYIKNDGSDEMGYPTGLWPNPVID